MLRTLFIIAALAAIVLIAKKMLTPPPRVEKKPSPRPLKDMVRCETCGLHLPVDEAIRESDHYFCSVEHRDHYRDTH